MRGDELNRLETILHLARMHEYLKPIGLEVCRLYYQLIPKDIKLLLKLTFV